MKAALAAILFAGSIFAFAPAAQAQRYNDDTPADVNSYESVQALAAAICQDSGYENYGYDSYETCFDDVISRYPYAYHDPSNASYLLPLPGGNAFRFYGIYSG
jgi:hypothetical protein